MNASQPLFGLWRSCQHFAEPASIPDATSESEELLLAAAPTLPRYGRALQFMASRSDPSSSWAARTFVRRGESRPTSEVQLRKYNAVRAGHQRWSNDNYDPLEAADHPERTLSLDARHLSLVDAEQLQDLARYEVDALTSFSAEERSQEAGYISDPKVRRAVELQAVSQAINYYESLGYQCEDVGALEPFDLLLSGTGNLPAERHVEVKGSSGSASKVELTYREVEHARRFQPTDLFVVSGIEWEFGGDSVTTRPGSPRLVTEWNPRDSDLLAVRFRHTVPAAETLTITGRKGAAT